METQNDKSKKIFAKLVKRQRIIFLLLFIISIVSLWANLKLEETNINSGSLINIAGKQRMLSQKVAFVASDFVNAKTDSERDEIKKHLLFLINSMRDNNEKIVREKFSGENNEIDTDALNEIYFRDGDNLSIDLSRFITFTQQLINANDHELTLESEVFQRIKRMALGDFIEKLNSVVTILENEDISRRQRLLVTLIGTHVALIVALLISAFAVFFPMVTRFSKNLRERDEAIQQVVIRQNQLNEAQKISNVGSWEIDWKTNEMTWSENLYNIFGLQPFSTQPSIELIKKHVARSSLDMVSNFFYHVNGCDDDKGIEFSITDSSNNIKSLLCNSKCTTDQQGNLIQSCGTISDVTYLRATENALFESEEMTALLLRESPIGSAVLDNSGTIKFVNARMLEITGMAKERLIGRKIFDLCDAPEQCLDRLFEANEKNAIDDHEIHLINGCDVWLLSSIVKIPSKDTHNYFGSFYDITDRKRIEKKLRTAEEQKSQILGGALDAIITADVQGVITDVNASALHLFQYEKSEMIGKTISETIVPEQYRDAHNAGMERFRKGIRGQAIGKRLEMTGHKKDGKNFPIELSIVYIPEQEIFTGFIRDLTGVRETEMALRHSMKMDALGKLTGGIAHDFNNLLAIAMGNLELISSEIEDPAISKRIEKSHQSLKRGVDLTRKLLSFSRKGAYSEKTCNLNINDVVTNLHDMIQKSLTASVEISAQLSPDLWQISADPGELEDALINLSVNARDAMPNGGYLVFQTKNVIFDTPLPAIPNPIGPGNFVVLEISDSGVGIPEEIKNRVFEPFFTTKEKGKGTGLGLSMVFGFVQRCKGAVKIYSEIDHGTTIKLYFPAIESATKTFRANKADLDKPVVGNETILVVDDEEGLRDVACSYLISLGFKTCTAGNVDDAIRELKRNNSIQMVFSDIVMPGGKDGVDLAKYITLKYPKIKMLLTSGFSESIERIKQSHDPLGNQLLRKMLEKPYDLQVLANVIRNNLDQEVVFAWSDDLSVGVEAIDEDHRALIWLTNNMFTAAKENNVEEAKSVFDAVLNYVQGHFEREEEILEKMGSGDLEEQKRLHLVLKKNVSKYRQLFETAPTEADLIGFGEFLKSWLVHHIQEDDNIAFKACLENKIDQ